MTAPLLDIIKDKIRLNGPMTVAEYMELCLVHPEYGYYMSRDPFGRAGDFITAPEVSQMFGEMVGLWIADLWLKLGSPSNFVLLECGPGRGTLMEDVMRATKTLPGFHQAAQLYLMEISPVLQAAQKQKLSQYNPVWITGLDQLPTSLPVMLIANEFLDALPVRQFWKKNEKQAERCVSLGDNNELIFVDIEWEDHLYDTKPTLFSEHNDTGLFEVSFVLNQFIKAVSNLLEKQAGIALFLDYGHARTATGNTLQAVKKHQYTDIFETPGLCDLTVHVDFENVARVAKSDQITILGPTTQRAFLQELGIEVRAERLKTNATADQRRDIETGLQRLIDTQQMGSLFKVMALCSDPEIKIAGFHEII